MTSEPHKLSPNRLLSPSAARTFFVTIVPKGGGLRKPPSIIGTGRNSFMRFSLNGRSSKLDFDDVHLMTVSEPEIKMAAINRKQV